MRSMSNKRRKVIAAALAVTVGFSCGGCGGGGSAGGKRGKKQKARVDVDDCVLFLARFNGGAVGSFEATRLAHGHQNNNNIEINGEKGSLRFAFEDMNVLWLFDARQDARTAGWQRVMCTAAGLHPYAESWWPDGHVVGYEHGFVNMVADMMTALGNHEPVVPLPDFADAYETQRVLEAAMLSAKRRAAVKLNEVK